MLGQHIYTLVLHHIMARTLPSQHHVRASEQFEVGRTSEATLVAVSSVRWLGCRGEEQAGSKGAPGWSLGVAAGEAGAGGREFGGGVWGGSREGAGREPGGCLEGAGREPLPRTATNTINCVCIS